MARVCAGPGQPHLGDAVGQLLLVHAQPLGLVQRHERLLQERLQGCSKPPVTACCGTSWASSAESGCCHILPHPTMRSVLLHHCRATALAPLHYRPPCTATRSTRAPSPLRPPCTCSDLPPARTRRMSAPPFPGAPQQASPPRCGCTPHCLKGGQQPARTASSQRRVTPGAAACCQQSPRNQRAAPCAPP